MATGCNAFESPPSRGAWIEIFLIYNMCILEVVAPLAGAWIEIQLLRENSMYKNVAPLAGGVD